ncbi:MAG: hypothetical protein JJU45_00550, partial [Acidimicrobiia bacterium]|nr:hypothetical protein [Acidimicrobiia bacterium]
SRAAGARRPRRPGGGGPGTPARPLGDPTAIASPPELAAFNEFLADQDAAAAKARRVKSLESAKDKAAAALRDAQQANAGREAVAEAEAAYRQALETLQAAKDGREPEPDAAAESGEADAGTPGTPGAEEATAGDDAADSDQVPDMSTAEAPVEAPDTSDADATEADADATEADAGDQPAEQEA